MKIPPNFKYIRTYTLDEYYEKANQTSLPLIISGGTVAVLMLKNRLIRPEAVIDISQIPELNVLKINKDDVFIGANMKLYKLKNVLPNDSASELIVKSASTVGDIAIRSMGSVGGNVCLGDPSNDLPVALTAIDAQAVIGKKDDITYLPITNFYIKPFKTVLNKGEILLGVNYKMLNGYRTSYKKHFINFLDHYVGIVAAIAKIEENAIKDFKMAIGGEAVGKPVKFDLSEFSNVDEIKIIKERIFDYVNTMHIENNRFGTANYKKKVLYTLISRAIDEVLKL